MICNDRFRKRFNAWMMPRWLPLLCSSGAGWGSCCMLSPFESFLHLKIARLRTQTVPCDGTTAMAANRGAGSAETGRDQSTLSNVCWQCGAIMCFILDQGAASLPRFYLGYEGYGTRQVIEDDRSISGCLLLKDLKGN